MSGGITDIILPSFYPVWNSFVTGRAKELWLKGGRGSTKSTFAAYCIVAGVMAHENVSAMVVRKHAVDIRPSVYNQIVWAITKIDELYPGQSIFKRWRFYTNPANMIFDGNRQIVFHGLDDPRKRKSEKPINGYFGYLWCEEFDEFSGIEEISSLKKSVLRGGKIGQTIFSFNPPKSQNNWVNVESAIKQDGREVYHSTYLEVEKHHPEWLGETFLHDAEILKQTNEKQYRYELLGEAVGSGGEIFDNLEARTVTDDEIKAFKITYTGLDFGFTIDPSALIKCAYKTDTREVFAFDEWYEYGQYTDGIAQAIRDIKPQTMVIADAAEPRVIAELRRESLNVRGCYKGGHFRDDGLRWLRSRNKIIIDPKRCPNLWREMTNYAFKKASNGGYSSSYPDGDDHAIDALRYGLEEPIRSSMGSSRILV